MKVEATIFGKDVRKLAKSLSMDLFAIETVPAMVTVYPKVIEGHPKASLVIDFNKISNNIDVEEGLHKILVEALYISNSASNKKYIDRMMLLVEEYAQKREDKGYTEGLLDGATTEIRNLENRN
jgi:hypothetical protein